MANAAGAKIAKDTFQGGEKFSKVSLGALTGNARSIASTLADAGWSQNQIAGALGRLHTESGFDPGAKRKGDNKKYKGELADSVGIGQWNGPRQQNLKAYAKALGQDWKDVSVQAGFLNHETFGNDDPAVKGKFGYRAEKRAANAMKEADSYESASKAMMHYERPRHYSYESPEKGMHYDRTIDQAEKHLGLMGAADSGEAVASAKSISKEKAPAADFSLASLVGSIFGGPSQLAAADSTVKAYRDPYVTKVDANPVTTAKAGKEKASVNPTAAAETSKVADADAPENRPRLGLGKLSEDIKQKKSADVVKGVVNAIRDPIGFVLNTVEDGWNQNGGLKGLQADLGNMEFKNPFSGESQMPRDGKYVDHTVPTRNGNPASTGGEQQVAAVDPNATAVTPVTPKKREPFWWSTLLGSNTFS